MNGGPSQMDLFDPKFKGKVTMLTEMRDSIGLVMLGDGKDPAKAPKVAELTISDDELRESIEANQLRLMKERGCDLTSDPQRAPRRAFQLVGCGYGKGVECCVGHRQALSRGLTRM